MQSVKDASHRIVYTAIGILLVVIVGLGVSGLAVSAAQVTERSIEVSNTSKDATGVNYLVTFTPVQDASAFVIDFCANSPVIGQACDEPTDFSLTDVEIGGGSPGFTVISPVSNRVVVEGSLVADQSITVDLREIVNPSTVGAMYARIVTFDSAAEANSSTATNLAGSIDEGGAVVAITDTIGVAGTVLESLTFCASQEAILDDCETITPPSIRLGEQVGDTIALAPGVLSEESLFVQLSTNATSGAVVRLKSTAEDCGGLLRAGETEECYIQPALDSGITENDDFAKFGVRTADATDTPQASNPTGVLGPVVIDEATSSTYYNNDTFALNFVDNNITGITSAFGDPFIDTAGGPATHKNMEITFGAFVTNETPAGVYSTDISLIAVGTF